MENSENLNSNVYKYLCLLFLIIAVFLMFRNCYLQERIESLNNFNLALDKFSNGQIDDLSAKFNAQSMMKLEGLINTYGVLSEFGSIDSQVSDLRENYEKSPIYRTQSKYEATTSVYMDFKKLNAAWKKLGGNKNKNKYQVIGHFGVHDATTAMVAYKNLFEENGERRENLGTGHEKFFKDNAKCDSKNQDCANKLYEGRLTFITQIYKDDKMTAFGDIEKGVYSRFEFGRLCPPGCKK